MKKVNYINDEYRIIDDKGNIIERFVDVELFLEYYNLHIEDFEEVIEKSVDEKLASIEDRLAALENVKPI